MYLRKFIFPKFLKLMVYNKVKNKDVRNEYTHLQQAR